MGDAIEELVRELIGDRACTVHKKPVWLHITPVEATLPEHGWKLHVSSRPSTFHVLVSKLVPILLDEGCAFKLANSARTLTDLNDGRLSPASVGKAFTIYPGPERIRALGGELVDLLRGGIGPRVRSDRRIDESAPVYYRYGPIGCRWKSDGRGMPVMLMRGPDGQAFDGEATLGFQVPPWATDPFDGADSIEDDLLLGDRYRVTAGIYESVRGNVFRAVDELTGQPVVVKQARALVAEDSDQADARSRIRNERRILEAAKGISGVPLLIDHFRHLDDEFLVTDDQGERNLGQDIHDNGPYHLGTESGRSLPSLARALARTLRDLHARGIIVRDLAPKNIVVDHDGSDQVVRPCLIDLGIAGYQGVHLFGFTPGYGPMRQSRNEPPLETDDLYALGMTLIEAMSGLPPVHFENGEHARARALETVHSLHGESPTGIVAAAADLLSDDPEVVRAALGQICERPAGCRMRSRLPSRPTIGAALLEEVTAHALEDLLATVDLFLEGPSSAFRQHISVNNGAAGAGLELLKHMSHPGVQDRLPRLAEALRQVAVDAQLEPGLFAGRTGIDIFFREAELPGLEPWAPAADWLPSGFDLMEGAAGIGIGHLLLHEQSGAREDLAIVQRCADYLAGVDHTDIALAHGLAGVLEFELRLTESAIRSEAERLADRLVPPTIALVERVENGSENAPITVAWCNGLTGAARTFLRAGEAFGRPDLTRLGMRMGEASASRIPRLYTLGQCCGAAGIGELLIDMGRPDEALEVVEHLLLRSGGPVEKPMFVRRSAEGTGSLWSAGIAGILGFLRRIRDGGGTRLFPGL